MFVIPLFEFVLVDLLLDFVIPLLIVVVGLVYFLGRSSNSFWLD